MAPRTLPGLGLNGFWALGEDGWKDTMDANLRVLSALVQCRVISKVTALPGSPTNGDMYIVPSGGDANKIALRDNGAWVYIIPAEGYSVYVVDTNETVQFDGAAWVVLVTSGIPSAYLDIDGTLAANSDVKVATQKAVKTYADALIAANDAMVFKGVTDCSTNPNYPAADRGHTYRASVAGKIGGASGVNVEVGDMFICLTDGTASGNQATVGSAWSIIQTNLDGAVINTRQVLAGTGLTGGGDLSADRTFNVDIGKQSVWIPAGAMKPRTTNGAAAGSLELTTNKNMVTTLDFDTATQEFAQFDIRMPKSWNESTVTFIPVWSHAATTTNFGVVWGLDAVAVSDNDALDTAFGTEQTSTDTGGTTNNSYQGPESAAITISGSPATGDFVMFRIHRNPADGSDTLAIDARLHGVLLLYTIDVLKDN